jgi:hypothetical protein
MIHIEKNQIVKDDPTLRVAVPTGDYNETDLIECYPKGGDPNEPTLMCQALYVAFGGAIYQQSEEITEDQVEALKSGTPIGDVINNKKLIDNKEPAAKYIGRVVKIDGPVGPRVLRTDMMPVDEEEPIVEPVTETPPPPVVDTDPVPNNTNPTTTPPTNISTTTPATPKSKKIKSVAPIDDEIIPLTPVAPTAELQPELTPVTNEDLEAVTDTVLDTVEAIVDPNASITTPARELVSYAKKKIKRKLRS